MVPSTSTGSRLTVSAIALCQPTCTRVWALLCRAQPVGDPCCAAPQVDEPALREGLPLKRARWESYLDWAVKAFRLSTVVAAPSTQIVTHLCYSEFADILPVRARPRTHPA